MSNFDNTSSHKMKPPPIHSIYVEFIQYRENKIEIYLYLA